MKAVKVEYTVKPEYVSTNQENITKVMEFLKSNPIEGMFYKAFLMDDGQSFMHINIAKDQKTMDKLMDVELFNEFRKQLKGSGPINAPKQTNLEKVGPGWDI